MNGQPTTIHQKPPQLVFFRNYLPYFQSAVTTVEKVLPFKIIFTLIFYLSQDSPIVHVWQRPELVSHKIGEGRLNGIKCMRFLMHKNEWESVKCANCANWWRWKGNLRSFKNTKLSNPCWDDRTTSSASSWTFSSLLAIITIITIIIILLDSYLSFSSAILWIPNQYRQHPH